MLCIVIIVIVFDEATSALDTVTEQAVMDAIAPLVNQITIILIAHRLSTVKHCDQLLLLEKRKIIANGTFDELNESNKLFRIMANRE